MTMSGDEHAADRSAPHGPEPTAQVADGTAAGGTGPASDTGDAARPTAPAARSRAMAAALRPRGGAGCACSGSSPGVHPYTR